MRDYTLASLEERQRRAADLTWRERTVAIALISIAGEQKDVAQALGISFDRLCNVRKEVFYKLDVWNRRHLIVAYRDVFLDDDVTLDDGPALGPALGGSMPP